MPCIGIRMATTLVAIVAIVAPGTTVLAKQKTREPGPEQNVPMYINTLGMKMVRIPRGTFTMGNDSPTPPLWANILA